jgi:hypothetical protein
MWKACAVHNGIRHVKLMFNHAIGYVGIDLPRLIQPTVVTPNLPPGMFVTRGRMHIDSDGVRHRDDRVFGDEQPFEAQRLIPRSLR